MSYPWSDLFPLLGMGWIITALLMTILWLVQRRTGNAAIVDVGWPASIPLLALIYLLAGSSGGVALPEVLATAMALLWGGRLALYLYRTRIHGHREEEGRYRQLREDWGSAFQGKLYVFYQAQAILGVVFSLPFALLAAAGADDQSVAPSMGVSPMFWGGLALWVLAFSGEALADRQLTRFKADPANRGKVCEAGLWAYSRHPNYFFEFNVWVAFALMALDAPGGWVAWLCPALMLFFLFRVTGIPATEEQALRSKGEAYRRYMATVSPFIPWFRRRVPTP